MNSSITYSNPIGSLEPIRNQILSILENQKDVVIAILVGIEGASYRPLGASMVFFPDGRTLGSLSSGCIEADLTHHVKTTLQSKEPLSVRYGNGSPYIDIILPCGGGLDILLIPNPEIDSLLKIDDQLKARQSCFLYLNTQTGKMQVENEKTPISIDADFCIHFVPETRFMIFGKGEEASYFAEMVNALNYPNVLLSPDQETLEKAELKGCSTQLLLSEKIPENVVVDRWTAILFFFHGHDWEPSILLQGLRTNAFYIGAQGSQKARNSRRNSLIMLGAVENELERIIEPIGLIKSTRDPRTLAVSVLAEILSFAS